LAHVISPLNEVFLDNYPIGQSAATNAADIAQVNRQLVELVRLAAYMCT
jgi:hypothetical protein